MPSQKKAIVRQFDGTLLWGYLPAIGILQNLEVQLLTTDGRVQPVPLEVIKSIAYVRDFNLNDAEEPERLGRRSFPGKPRSDGLWLRVEFRDKDAIEGLVPPELGVFDALIEDRCLALAPPDQKSNTYRLLIPRAALVSFQLLGVIAPSAKRKAHSPQGALQTDLFESS